MLILKLLIFIFLTLSVSGWSTFDEFLNEISLPKDPNSRFFEKIKQGKINLETDFGLGFGFNISNLFNFGEYLKNEDINNVVREKLEKGHIKLHPDFGLDIYHFLRKYEYPVETHWVHTEDGYVLRMHRILAKNGTLHAGKSKKPAVLLMHGLAGSSMHFIGLGPEKSLAFQLVNQGFDVWLGNNRGNTWSRQHVELIPDTNHEFWDFSYEKCGQYDIPAKIDYIIEKTGQQKIFYVGHSQGTTQFFAMAALRPEYNEKIALMSALAPVVYVQHMASPIYRLAQKYQEKVEVILKNQYELLSYNWLGSRIRGLLCAEGSPVQELCALTLFMLSGFDSPQLNRTVVSVYMTQSPNGISKNTLLHYGQNIKSGYFQRYDYGSELNMKYYESAIPPNFTISDITAPIALYYSENDFFVPVEAVERLSKELPNVVKKVLIKYKLFNHLDYVLAKDVNKYVNKPLIEHMLNITNEGGTTTTTTLSPPAGDGANSKAANYVFCVIAAIFSILFRQ